jgi:hypothetical protein
LGSDLSEQGSTFELGQDLEQLDLEGAAEALENLSDQFGELPEGAREQLEDAMGAAGDALEGTDQQDLAEDLQSAAEALGQAGPPEGQSGNPAEQEAQDRLNDVAQDLRELAPQVPGGEQAGSGQDGSVERQSGQPEPAERLQGQGEDMQLEIDDPSQSGLLSPAPQAEAGPGTASGSLDSSQPASDDVIDSPLVPNSFLWKWRDVVSSYFER